MKYKYKGETKVLDAAARAEAPGRFIKLSDGVVHYELAGPPHAMPVVLVHGFSVPYYVWDPTCPALVEAGLRTLRYDLFGRGYSDRPRVAYNIALFDRQLVTLLDGLDMPVVDLVGLSMGGAIAAEFTARHPDRVRKLCLIDPAGLPMTKSWKEHLLTIPLLGEVILENTSTETLLAGQKDDFYLSQGEAGKEMLDRYQEKYPPQMEYVGFKGAVLSTIRSNVVRGSQQAFAQVGRQSRQVLLIWGRHDITVPFPLSELTKKLIPQAELHVIEDAAHVPHYERPEVVNPLLIGFLKD